MSLIVPGLGKTITPKRRRPSPKAKIIGRGKVTANPNVTDSKPRPKPGSKPSGKKFAAPGGSAPSRPSRKKSTFGKKYEGPLRPGIRPSRPSPIKANSGKKFDVRPGMRPSRPSRIKASSKRGGARPMSSPPRRPSGRR